MNSALLTRVGRLEQECARARRAREAVEYAAEKANVAEQAREKVREILRIRGVVQDPNESLAEAFARCLGITCMQLKNYLAARAARTTLR